MSTLKIAVLFDGAGLARLGLEQAGHECTGFELNPIAHHLSQFVGSGNCVLQDAKTVDLSLFQAAWCSPPCQGISSARTESELPKSEFSQDETLMEWSLTLGKRFQNLEMLWVENVTVQETDFNKWGRVYNAAQFLQTPIQNRNRIIGGYYPPPYLLRPYKKAFKGICPCITATEYKGSSSPKETRRACRFYGRKLTMFECAFHQGFEIPEEWHTPALGLTQVQWNEEIYRAIGNGVPVYMARAFGEAAAGYE